MVSYEGMEKKFIPFLTFNSYARGCLSEHVFVLVKLCLNVFKIMFTVYCCKSISYSYNPKTI